VHLAIEERRLDEEAVSRAKSKRFGWTDPHWLSSAETGAYTTVATMRGVPLREGEKALAPRMWSVPTLRLPVPPSGDHGGSALCVSRTAMFGLAHGHARRQIDTRPGWLTCIARGGPPGGEEPKPVCRGGAGI
jgi:hypothetical protein